MKESRLGFKMILGIIFVLLGVIMIYFNSSFSPIKKDFEKDLSRLIENNKKYDNDVFSKDDFKDYPIAIQKYIENNGFIGKSKMDYAFMDYKDVDFAQNQNRKLSVNYKQYNFAHNPNRIALVESSMFGIPFEGYDYYIDGTGGMRGMIAKSINLFDQKGSNMDKGALCTYLAEILFIPSSILYNENIILEEINQYQVRATIVDNGIKVSGIFSFNDDYEFKSFYTEDRPAVADDGSVSYIPWSANVLSYKKIEDGINFIDHVQIIWHYPDQDLIYFDGNLENIIYY